LADLAPDYANVSQAGRPHARDDDLTAARAIGISDLSQALADAHGRLVPMRRHHVTIFAAAKVLLSPSAPAAGLDLEGGPAYPQLRHFSRASVAPGIKKSLSLIP